MCTVDLNDRLYDSLLYFLHSIQLFIQNSSRFIRIDCFKVITLPLNIHHDRKCSLCVTALFLRNLMRTCNCKISSCPQTNVIRKCTSCACHKVCNTLNTCKLHVISGLFLLVIIDLFFWRITCKQPLDHKLKEAVLSR